MELRKEETTNLIITGVGGQGNVLAARILAAVALAEGYEVTVGDVYGITQRGGSVSSHVRWTRGNPLPPSVPINLLDILVAFEPMEALRVLAQYGQENTAAIVNDTPVIPIGVQTGRFHYPSLDELWNSLQKLTKKLRLVKATTIALELGNIQVFNIVMLGALCGSGFVELKSDIFEQTINSSLPKRFIDINLRAFRAGYDFVKTSQNPSP